MRVWRMMSKHDTRGGRLDEGMEWRINARYPRRLIRYGYGIGYECTIPTRQARCGYGMENKCTIPIRTSVMWVLGRMLGRIPNEAK